MSNPMQPSLFPDLTDPAPAKPKRAQRMGAGRSVPPAATAPGLFEALAVAPPAGSETTVAPSKVEGLADPQPTPLPLNFAELERRLRAAQPNDRKNADMRSALRTTGKVLNLPLERISTAPAELSPLLANASPLAAQVSPARWSRVRSLVLQALVAGGADVLPGRDLQGLSPLWADLADQLPNKRTRVGLTRLLSYFSREGISPKEVTAADIEAFGQALEAKSLRRKPVQTYRTTVRLWNSVNLPGWPAVRVELEANPRLYARPWEEFPTTFLQDVENFHANASDPNPFREHFSRPVRPATRDARHKQIRQVASALVASGFPIEDIKDLKVLTRPANAEAALRHLLGRRNGKLGEHLEAQARLLQTIASHWVRDQQAADAIGRMSVGLHVKKTGMTAKNRFRLKQFDLQENVRALLRLPLTVFAEERHPKRPTQKQARRAERAFAIELLLVAPMRMGNLTEIQIGRHLVEFRRGKHKRYHLIFTPEETKTSEPFEVELPQQTAVLLEIYLERYRPVLCPEGSQFLFAGGKGEGGERSSVAFSSGLKDFLLAETGLVMHGHLFRQFAGKFYLSHHPNDIETVRRILTHRSTATTLRSYAHVRADLAFRSYDALVEATRGANSGTVIARKRRQAAANLKKRNGANG